MNAKTIWQRFDDLPPEAQQQVLDFIAFLQERSVPAHSRRAEKRTKPGLRREAFIGMWRNREDLSDSTAWVRAQRTREWVRPRE